MANLKEYDPGWSVLGNGRFHEALNNEIDTFWKGTRFIIILIPARGAQTRLKLSAGLGYPGLGTLTTSKNSDIQAIGSWA